MDDNDDSLSNVNAAHLSGSLTDDNFAASEEFFGSEESYGYNDFADEDATNESPVESDNSSFTTSQKCVTSLMYLLDAMECPDYGFQTIMDWAHKSLKLALTLI
jgi:hypothetical protein